MTEEDFLSTVVDVDEFLSEIEKALEEKDYSLASEKVKEAKSAIEDLREEYEIDDDREVEMDVMRKLK